MHDESSYTVSRPLHRNRLCILIVRELENLIVGDVQGAFILSDLALHHMESGQYHNELGGHFIQSMYVCLLMPRLYQVLQIRAHAAIWRVKKEHLRVRHIIESQCPIRPRESPAPCDTASHPSLDVQKVTEEVSQDCSIEVRKT